MNAINMQASITELGKTIASLTDVEQKEVVITIDGEVISLPQSHRKRLAGILVGARKEAKLLEDFLCDALYNPGEGWL